MLLVRRCSVWGRCPGTLDCSEGFRAAPFSGKPKNQVVDLGNVLGGAAGGTSSEQLLMLLFSSEVGSFGMRCSVKEGSLWWFLLPFSFIVHQ